MKLLSSVFRVSISSKGTDIWLELGQAIHRAQDTPRYPSRAPGVGKMGETLEILVASSLGLEQQERLR